MQNENDDVVKLREMLALAYSGPSKLYSDDGELFDATEKPYIDYRHDLVDVIKQKINERGKNRFFSSLDDLTQEIDRLLKLELSEDEYERDTFEVAECLRSARAEIAMLRLQLKEKQAEIDRLRYSW